MKKLLDICTHCVYNKDRKEVNKMKRKKKSKSKNTVDVATILLSAFLDLLVGFILLVIDKLT